MPLFRNQREEDARWEKVSMEYSFQRYRICHQMFARFELLCPKANPYRWLAGYDSLPSVQFDDVTLGFGDMVQKIKWIGRPEEKIPREFQWKLPPGADVARASAGVSLILAECADQTFDGLKAWEAQSNFRIDAGFEFMPQFVTNVRAVTLFHMRYLYGNLFRTMELWNDSGFVGKTTQEDCEWWLTRRKDASAKLNVLVRNMEVAVPQRLASLGFIDEMWEFLGVNYRRGF